MKIAYFYRDHNQVYSVYCNEFEDVLKEPDKYYEDYVDGDVISEYNIEKPYIENGNVREATKEENLFLGRDVDLSDGELIVDGKIVKIERPSKYHYWDNGSWELNLEESKERKRSDLKKKREELLEKNLKITLKDTEYEFQMRNNDIKNFESFKNMLEILKTLGITPENFSTKGKKVLKSLGTDTVKDLEEFFEGGKVRWIMADNSSELFDFDSILLVQSLYYIRKEKIFNQYIKLSEALAEADSIEKFMDVEWKEE